MIKLGVDNGNYNTKSSEGMLYASGYTASDKEFITPDMQLFYEGRYYAVGERRMRFQQDKTREPDTFMLTLPAIADAMKRGNQARKSPLAWACPLAATGRRRRHFGDIFCETMFRSCSRERLTDAASPSARCSRRVMRRCAGIIRS